MTLRDELKLAEEHEQAGRLPEAAAVYQGCLKADPLSPSVCNLLGNVLGRMGRREEAAAVYRRGLSLEPKDHLAMNGLAIVLTQLGQYDQAVELLQRAAALRPDSAATLNNLAGALRESGRLEESIGCFERLLAQWPQNVSGHWGLALALLQAGDFERGWREYEWRWRVPDLRLRLKLYSPRWDGGDLRGKTIVVHGEQGLGDNIQFARYIPSVVERGAKVILVCQPELLGLWQGFKAIEQCVSDESPPPPHDVHAPLMSLPGIFGTTAQTIPAQVPYLFVEPERVETWRAMLPGDARKKIGLVWSGLAIHPNDHNRSVPLAALDGLGNLPDAWFCSLQKGDAARQATGSAIKLADWTEKLDDFRATAALIAALDLVISVDTAVAHLAGALGKPVWMLIPFSPDWRWMTHRTDSPWYPTMKLFRQPRSRDWAVPINRVVEELKG